MQFSVFAFRRRFKHCAGFFEKLVLYEVAELVYAYYSEQEHLQIGCYTADYKCTQSDEYNTHCNRKGALVCNGIYLFS